MPGKHEVWSYVRHSPLRLGLYGAVLAALLGGAFAYTTFDKALVLTVDGQERKVHTFASTVGGVLEDHDIEIGPHDTVAPGLDAKVSDGTRIAVRYGRLISVSVDGQERDVWVTAGSVQEALHQIGVRDTAAFVSVSRSTPIGRQGLAFDIRLPHQVRLDVEGKVRKIETTAPTVAAAIVEAGIPLTDRDLVIPDRGIYPKDGQLIKVYKISGKVDTRTVSVSYKTRQISDADLYEGDAKVVREGQKGSRRVTYELVRKDGAWVIKRELFSRTLAEPALRIVRVGTKERPAPAPAPEPQPTPETTSVPSGGGSGSGLNWAALAECESGGNPRAVNPAGYYGLYQFTLSTWESVGGSGNPIDASSAEQTMRAQILYDRAGDSPWPVCGSRLYS